MKRILLFSISLILSLLTFEGATAQTLSAGDIAFVGWNTDAPDEYAFVTLVNIPANEVIYFTEEGWNSVVSNRYCNGEPHLTWVAPAGGLPAGTIVEVTETSVDIISVSSGSISFAATYNSFNLSAGDNVIAYQSNSGAAPNSPTFLSALLGDDNYFHTIGCDDVSNWFDCSNCTQAATDCNTTSVSTSGLPIQD